MICITAIKGIRHRKWTITQRRAQGHGHNILFFLNCLNFKMNLKMYELDHKTEIKKDIIY